MQHNYTHPTHKELLTIFNVSPTWANLQKRKWIKTQITRLNNDNDDWHSMLNTSKSKDDWLIHNRIKVVNSKLNKLNTSLRFLQQKYKDIQAEQKAIKNNEPIPQPKYTEYDKDAIRNIPIRTILERHGTPIIANRKFALRNEKTPSCWIYETTNTYTDFGDSNRTGDVIDLYMRLNGITFQEALKELSYLI